MAIRRIEVMNKNTFDLLEENINKLSCDIVEGWDMSSLVGFAIDTLREAYTNKHEDFLRDWENFYGMGVGDEADE
jgi:hypothetical protein